MEEFKVKNSKKILGALLISIFTISAVGCNMIAKTPEAIANSVVAKVNSDKIVRSDVEKNPTMTQYIAQLKQTYGDNYSTNADATSAIATEKASILTQLIDEKLFLQKAKELNLMPSDADLTTQTNAKFDTIKKTYPDAATFTSALTSAGFNETSLKAYLKTQIIIGKVQDALTKDVKVTDAQIKTYYDANQLAYTTKPDTIHVAHILVATPDVATKAKARVDKGEDFAKVAKELSTDTGSKDKGGDIAQFAYGDTNMDATFAAAAFKLKVGQISAPIQTQYGYHVIKCIAKTEYPVKKLSDVTADIKSTLISNAKQTLITAKVDEWTKAAKITKYDKNLN